MNTEEIQMLIELFSNVSDGAYTLVLIYMTKLYLNMLLGYALIVFAIIIVIKLIKSIITQFSFGEQLKAIMGYHGEFTQSEKDAIIETLKKGQN